jgi:hypothetical protein
MSTNPQSQQSATTAQQEQEFQQIIDRAAYFNLLTTADPRQPSVPQYANGAGGGLTGVAVHGIGHRFDVTVYSGPRGDLRASNVVGEPALTFSFRWLPIPDDYEVLPGKTPPATALDTSRSQRFAILDGEFAFAPSGETGFLSFGSGLTFPLNPGDPTAVRLAGVGNVLAGTGELAGREGIYVLSGLFRPPADFRLNILIRINDVERTLAARGRLPAPRLQPDPARGSTFMTFYASGEPGETEPIPVPSGLPPGEGFATPALVRKVQIDFFAGPRGIDSEVRIGKQAGYDNVKIWLFPSEQADGGVLSPIPYFDQEEFVFVDQEGKSTGTLRADVIEGRSILTPLAGIPQEYASQVVGAFALIKDGTGQFAGCQGMATNVGGGTVNPNLTSLVYLFEIFDPAGKFRAR